MAQEKFSVQESSNFLPLSNAASPLHYDDDVDHDGDHYEHYDHDDHNEDDSTVNILKSLHSLQVLNVHM